MRAACRPPASEGEEQENEDDETLKELQALTWGAWRRRIPEVLRTLSDFDNCEASLGKAARSKLRANSTISESQQRCLSGGASSVDSTSHGPNARNT